MKKKITLKQQNTELIETIPDFSFNNIATQQLFTNKNLNPDKNKLIIYFNSTCDLCGYEAKSIQEEIDQFSTVQILFISDEEIEEIQKFGIDHGLTEIENVHVLQDQNYLFANQLHISSTPFLLFYNKNNQLITSHKGQLMPNRMVAIFQE